jgi:hypothetical protein
MFRRIFRQIFSTQLLTVSHAANCEPDNGSFLLLLGEINDLNSKLQHTEIDGDQLVPQNNETFGEEETTKESCSLVLDVEEVNEDGLLVSDCYSDSFGKTISEENACCYVIGYLLNKLEVLHGSCVVCRALLHSPAVTVDDPRQVFTWLKAYPTIKTTSSFGQLKLPSDIFYTFIMRCESIFMEYFAIHAHEPNIISQIVTQLEAVPLNGACKEFPRYDMLRFFCRVRINYILKFANRDFVTCPKKQRKLFKIQSI